MSDIGMDNSSDAFENGKEIVIHDGILLKHASANYISELNTSGSLSLVEYQSKKVFCIEWRPNDSILISDTDTQEQDDWSLVDTIAKRQRTISESIIFNAKGEVVPNIPPRPHIRVPLTELRFIEVLAKGHDIRLVRKTDGTIHSSFFFQNGNADVFVGALLKVHVVRRIRENRNCFEILDSDEEKLQKTFAELQIDEIKNSGGWLSNMVRRNMDFLAKVSEYVPHQPTSSDASPISPNRNDEYEVLNGLRLEHDSEKHDNNDEKNTSQPGPSYKLPERRVIQRGSPLTEKQWREFHAEDGRLSDPQKIKEIIFRGGIEHQLRSEVWKYLLNYDIWEESSVERLERRRKKTAEYYQMKAQWLSMSTTQERNFSGYRDRKCQIEKDVKRTDRTQEFFAGEDNPNLGVLQDILMTYVMYNFDLGYVQGMSDLLAPILAIMQNEPDSFWCFVGFMDLVVCNFDIDQAGMKRQLGELNRLLEFSNSKLYNYLKEHGSENMYFCFRWLLVWFKREFSVHDVCELWECLWTGLACPNYHIFICLAILDEQVKIFIHENYEFNEILKHVNELSMKIDLKLTLEVAEAIYEQVKSAETITDDIRLIIGMTPLNVRQDTPEAEFDDNFEDDIVADPTPEELEVRQRKLELACEQSMYYSFL